MEKFQSLMWEEKVSEAFMFLLCAKDRKVLKFHQDDEKKIFE